MKKRNFLLIIIGLMIISALFQQCEPTYYVTRGNAPTSGNSSSNSGASEFEILMKKDATDRQTRSAEAINQFLNDSPSDPKSAILFNNKTNCNIIIRISGKGKSYNLPVEKLKINYIVLDKGSYSFKANLCNSRYNVNKNVTESFEINLSER